MRFWTSDPSRITSVQIFSGEALPEPGGKVSKKSFFGGVIGEYRAGSRKLMVFGKARAIRPLVITLQHPTVDKICYYGNDADVIHQLMSNDYIQEYRVYTGLRTRI